MEGFKSFVQAVDLASDFCRRWTNSSTGEVVEYDDMMEIAAVLDLGGFLDVEHWYLVYEDGEICLLSEISNTLYSMFLPIKSRGVKNKIVDWEDEERKIIKKEKRTSGRKEANAGNPTGNQSENAEPIRMEETAREINFCPNCGNKLRKNARFCTNCGEKIERDLL